MSVPTLACFEVSSSFPLFLGLFFFVFFELWALQEPKVPDKTQRKGGISSGKKMNSVTRGQRPPLPVESVDGRFDQWM
ncbi:hypothetical protein DM860_016843 [Cuscuta australis]|uniref:Uncharacterized protein n=1 Tax=Cuscuta australis TaxID=267555 RepID=A0A328CXB8_9ASTE|nr:hypothetical protein DM860_016843 [Cuscuta australis]